MAVKIVAFADTHNNHAGMSTSPCDILVHCGDFTNTSKIKDAEDFLTWFSAQKAGLKVLLPGNHDLVCVRHKPKFQDMCHKHGVAYLENNGIDYMGIKIWGVAYARYYLPGAVFDLATQADFLNKLSSIPSGTDILLTHKPPFGILDTNSEGEPVGSKTLLDCVSKLKPRFHCFGHAHNRNGIFRNQFTAFHNVSVANNSEELVYRPHELEI